MAYDSKAKQREHNAKWYVEHKPEQQQRQHQWYLQNKAKVLEQSRQQRLKNPEYHKQKTKATALKEKTLVLTYYGKGKCACVRCGFTDIRTLSIDHINGRGNLTRVPHLYLWLIKNNYPEGFQTLCMNCQWIKRVEDKEQAWSKSIRYNKTIKQLNNQPNLL